MTKDKKKFNTLEKITFTFGLIVTLGLLVFLIYQIYSQDSKSNPPELVITSSYEPKISPYAYKVVVENIGEETAEEANIQLSLYQQGKEVAKGAINIMYVPVKSKETAWIVFHTRKKPGDSLIVSSVTYVKP